MKVLLILMVAVALAQASPEGRVKQDLGVLNVSTLFLYTTLVDESLRLVTDRTPWPGETDNGDAKSPTCKLSVLSHSPRRGP